MGEFAGMNLTLDLLLKRKSIRAFENRPVEPEVKAKILHATLRAPMVWVFLADYQRWYDYFLHCGVDKLCERENHAITTRFDEKFIVFENGYHRLSPAVFDEMFAERESRLPKGAAMEGISNFDQATYLRKFGSDFAMETSRSAREWLKGWQAPEK